MIWFIGRLATEEEFRAEEYREKIQRLTEHRGQRRQEIVSLHRRLAAGGMCEAEAAPMPIPASLAELLARVRRATAAYGQKKALALHIKASQSQVSNWLTKSGTRRVSKPSGEFALRMLAWLLAREGNQKGTRRAKETGQRN